MEWLDDLENAVRFKEQERIQYEGRQHQRMLAMQEQGPLFFAKLKELLRTACARPAFKKLVLNDHGDRNFSLEDPDSRPITRVRAHLDTIELSILAETCSSSISTYCNTASVSVEFGVDENGKLSLCIQCRPITLEGVADLIIRYALGLR